MPRCFAGHIVETSHFQRRGFVIPKPRLQPLDLLDLVGHDLLMLSPFF